MVEVLCEWDPNAHVWYVSGSNLVGLTAQAPTREKMADALRRIVPRLARLNPPAPESAAPAELLVLWQERIALSPSSGSNADGVRP